MSRGVAASFVFGLVALAVAPRGASAALPEQAYTLRELLDRSALIVVGTVQPGEGSTAARVRSGTIVVRSAVKGEPIGESISFRVDGPPLPAGALAVWILAAPGPDGVYVVDHPQCAYDVTHLGILRRAVADPNRVRPGYYLRREDERLAEAIRKAKEMKLLESIAPGPSPDGLKVDIRLASRSPRAGRGIALDFIVTNTSKRAMLICDSAEECYYVRASRGRPPKVEVGRAGAVALEVERKLGLASLVSEHDFVELRPGATTRRTLSVSAKVIQALRESGTVTVSGIYRYSSPQTPLVELPSNPWTGAVASAEIVVELAEPLKGVR